MSFTIFQIEATEVEEQVPFFKVEANHLEIFREFVAMAAMHSVGIPEVVARERIVGMSGDHSKVSFDRLRIILGAEEVVRGSIANLVVIGGAAAGG
jgi:hypothetical protein